MLFYLMINALVILFVDSICILDTSFSCVVPLQREQHTKTLSAIHLAKGLRKKELTFLVVVRMKEAMLRRLLLAWVRSITHSQM